MAGSEGNSPNSPPSANGAAGKQAITPELVQQVADRVFALLIQEMQIERERSPRNRGVKRYDRR
jgi:hypothetical protein